MNDGTKHNLGAAIRDRLKKSNWNIDCDERDAFRATIKAANGLLLYEITHWAPRAPGVDNKWVFAIVRLSDGHTIEEQRHTSPFTGVEMAEAFERVINASWNEEVKAGMR